MKLVRIVPFAFLLAIGAAGCGKAKEKTAGEKIVDEIEAMADAVCKCPKGDNACMEKAMKDDDALEEKLMKEFKDESKVPEALGKRIDAAEKKAEKCALGETPPDGPGTGAGTGTGTAATGPSEDDQLVAEVTKIGETICACADQACFDAEAAKIEPLMDRIGKLPADKQTKIEEIKKSVEACAAKLGGGGGPTPPPASGDAEAVLKEFEALKDEVCKCTDMACAEAAMNKGDALEDKLEAAYPDGKIPDDAMARLEGVEKGAKECVEKIAQ